MKKYIPLLLAALVGSCVGSMTPAIADTADKVVDATIMVVLVDIETGDKRTMVCAPAPSTAQKQSYR